MGHNSPQRSPERCGGPSHLALQSIPSSSPSSTSSAAPSTPSHSSKGEGKEKAPRYMQPTQSSRRKQGGHPPTPSTPGSHHQPNPVGPTSPVESEPLSVSCISSSSSHSANDKVTLSALEQFLSAANEPTAASTTPPSHSNSPKQAASHAGSNQPHHIPESDPVSFSSHFDMGNAKSGGYESTASSDLSISADHNTSLQTAGGSSDGDSSFLSFAMQSPIPAGSDVDGSGSAAGNGTTSTAYTVSSAVITKQSTAAGPLFAYGSATHSPATTSSNAASYINIHIEDEDFTAGQSTATHKGQPEQPTQPAQTVQAASQTGIPPVPQAPPQAASASICTTSSASTSTSTSATSATSATSTTSTTSAVPISAPKPFTTSSATSSTVSAEVDLPQLLPTTCMPSAHHASSWVEDGLAPSPQLLHSKDTPKMHGSPNAPVSPMQLSSGTPYHLHSATYPMPPASPHVASTSTTTPVADTSVPTPIGGADQHAAAQEALSKVNKAAGTGDAHDGLHQQETKSRNASSSGCNSTMSADGAHTAPLHGVGQDLDLTGTWHIVWTDEDSQQLTLGKLEMEHSSFGHLAGYWVTASPPPPGGSYPASCHGWHWGGSGYIQLTMPEPELGSLRRVHLMTLRYVRSSPTEEGSIAIYLEGERRADDGSVYELQSPKAKFEVTVHPKVYTDMAFGDEASRDLILEVQGSKFHVHTAVLATFMPHLRKVLNSGMQETKGMVPCPGDSPHAWRVLIERIYDITGCFHASAALKVLPLLDKYQIPKLWSEAVAELKRLPQGPRPHPHVLDMLCRCEAHEVIEHWFRVDPPDADELTLFVRDCQEADAARIVAQRAADRWRRDTADLLSQVGDLTAVNRTLQRHIEAIRHVVTTHAAPAAAWRLQTMVVPDFYISNNLPPPLPSSGTTTDPDNTRSQL